MALADLVVVMNGGRIEQQGTPREVFNRPRTAFVARFIGGHNVIAVRAHHARRCGPIASRVSKAAAEAASRSTVTEVGYQGAIVQMTTAAFVSELAPDRRGRHRR